MKYIEHDGTIVEKEDAQDRLLRTLYTKTWGRMLLRPLVSPAISRAAGFFLDSRLSRCLIRPFIKQNQMDMSPYVERQYRSYNDFFTREIKPEERMIDYHPHHLISPSDGKASAYRLTGDCRFQVKHSTYSLHRILKSRKLAKRYREGYALVIRLTVDDYHRYCYPAGGIKTENFHIPGIFHTVNPIACETVPVYHENTREFTLLRTKSFGTILQMEVGALMVGRICNDHGKARVKKGQEKGKFEFGGSTIILFLEKDKVKLKPGLLEHTREGCETLVRMGECIARRPEICQEKTLDRIRKFVYDSKGD